VPEPETDSVAIALAEGPRLRQGRIYGDYRRHPRRATHRSQEFSGRMADPGSGNDSRAQGFLAMPKAQAMLQLIDGQIERAVLVASTPDQRPAAASTATPSMANYGDAGSRSCYSIQMRLGGCAGGNRRLNGAQPQRC